MSKLVESLFRPPLRRKELSGKSRTAYFLLGVLAAISLATAYWSPYQLLHQILTSVGIYGMVALGALEDIWRKGWGTYRRGGGLFQDAMVAGVWSLLLIIWIMDPQV